MSRLNFYQILLKINFVIMCTRLGIKPAHRQHTTRQLSRVSLHFAILLLLPQKLGNTAANAELIVHRRTKLPKYYSFLMSKKAASKRPKSSDTCLVLYLCKSCKKLKLSLDGEFVLPIHFTKPMYSLSLHSKYARNGRLLCFPLLKPVQKSNVNRSEE